MSNPNPRHDAHAFIRRICRGNSISGFEIQERPGKDNQIIAFALDANGDKVMHTVIRNKEPVQIVLEQPFRTLGAEANAEDH
jgi:hypothetical protein